MDLKRKVALLKVANSYWDLLPVEVQAYIWDYKVKQEYLDESQKKQWNELCREIVQYGELTKKWGGGFIYIYKCSFHARRFEIWGAYVNECWNMRYMFLGDTLKESLTRFNHVKSFL